MNDDQMDDLKQFITATVSQTEERLTNRIDGLDNRIDKLEVRIDSLEQKIDDVDAKLDTIAETLHGRIEDHEVRITKLETV